MNLHHNQLLQFIQIKTTCFIWRQVLIYFYYIVQTNQNVNIKMLVGPIIIGAESREDYGPISYVQLHLGEDWNNLMSKLVPNSGLLEHLPLETKE
jgi:hypothetical protein